MTNDSEKIPQHQPGTEGAEDFGADRMEQFNELSELSLEERMNVADQLGIPVGNRVEAVATGTASGSDEADEGFTGENEVRDSITGTEP